MCREVSACVRSQLSNAWMCGVRCGKLVWLPPSLSHLHIRSQAQTLRIQREGERDKGKRARGREGKGENTLRKGVCANVRTALSRVNAWRSPWKFVWLAQCERKQGAHINAHAHTHNNQTARH